VERFPEGFVDDVKTQADILQVVQDYVPLRKAGTSYKGLCPFHTEKTPSFHVSPDKGFFHCFGCGTGGDVVKFVELQDKLSFPEAVRQLAQRFGLQVPESDDSEADASARARNEALLTIHEAATAFFQDQLRSPPGARARAALAERDVWPETIDRLALGYAPPERERLKHHLLERGHPLELLVTSGLIVPRDGGHVVDRFRNRLMIPIYRDGGSVIAFGGRALERGQQPKYVNSPETPLYTKGRTLYGLHLTKTAIRRLGYAVMVEGYFDFAQALQAGVEPVVATCGTAVTDPHVRGLRRFTTKVILSFDPDDAGAGASARSGELLLAAGFQVNVAVLAEEEDPDTSIRRHGGEHYVAQLKHSQSYLDYVLDRAAARHDLNRPAERRLLLNEMLSVAAKIPEAATRDQFADRLAHKARILEDVVRTEIRRAAVSRQTTIQTPGGHDNARVTPAERGLIWATMREPALAQSVLVGMEPEDFEGLTTTGILRVARTLAEWPADTVAATLLERVDELDAALVRRIANEPAAPADVEDSAVKLRLLRYERERATIQDEIARYQSTAPEHLVSESNEIDTLFLRKHELLQRIEALKE